MLLVLCVLAVAWIRRGGGRRTAGVVLAVAVALYAIVPALISDLRGQALQAQYTSASFWPEDIAFAGSTVILVGPTARTCGALCEAVLRADVVAVYIVERSDGALLSESAGSARAINNGQDRPTLEPAPLPATADWVIVQDTDARHTLSVPDIELDEAARAQVNRAIHVYAAPSGDLSAPLTPVARMIAGFRTDLPYITPILPTGQFVPPTTPYGDVLQRWLCDPSGTPRCPFLF